MKIKYKNNRKHAICDNLEEFFTEFKKYRNAKSDIATKENYSEHVFPYSPVDKDVIEGKKPPELFLVDLDYEEPKTEPFWTLGLDISPANIKNVEMGSEWDKKEREIRKILHEIWEIGSFDTRELELNWPLIANSNPQSSTNQSNKENKLILWMVGGVVFVFFVFLLAFWFRRREKKTRGKKNGRYFAP